MSNDELLMLCEGQWVVGVEEGAHSPHEYLDPKNHQLMAKYQSAEEIPSSKENWKCRRGRLRFIKALVLCTLLYLVYQALKSVTEEVDNHSVHPYSWIFGTHHRRGHGHGYHRLSTKEKEKLFLYVLPPTARPDIRRLIHS